MNTVQFPGLWGLEFSISRVAFKVFGIEIYWYGVIIAFGFLLAVLLAMKSSKDFGIEPDSIIDLVLYATPAAIVAARLYYVVFSWDSFKDNLWEVFNTRKGGLAIYGGVLGAVIVGYVFARAKKIGVFKLFDFAAPYLVLAQGIGRWGNFVNQEAFGTNTNLPWGMTSESIREYLRMNVEELSAIGINVNPDFPVHPTFLYESLWDVGLFFFLIWYRRKKKLDGEVFFLYMILYGVGRFWIEGLRTDSLMLGSFRVSQLLAALFAVILTAIFFIRRKKVGEDKEMDTGIGTSSYGAVLKELQEQEKRQYEHENNSPMIQKAVEPSDTNKKREEEL
ncbi:MAG: prolipoprotein diacylglyceryl transferase [Acetivibrionales bacterium]|jgi:phosphatidylglycerol:prolipoprotein diacylglycerol transferase